MLCQRPRLPEKGIALVVVLLALLVLASVAGGLVVVSSSHLMHAQSGNESQEALYAAKAGAWIKLGQVRTSGNLDPIELGELPASKASYSATVTVGDGSEPFPPKDTYYVEAVGTSAGGKVRRIGVLASLSESRWNHAAFGNREVVLKPGSYTDSFNSEGLAVDHSEASVATNNPTGGIVIEDHEAVVIGWSGSVEEASSGKRKKRRSRNDGDPKLVAEADAQGPPGSTEGAVVKGSEEAGRSYNNFVTGSESANTDPVVMPTDVPPGDDTVIGAVLDPISSLPNITTVAPVSLRPGAYGNLQVSGGGVATLDVSSEPPGSEVEYVFHGINLNGGILQVAQPPGADPVTVKVYIDTGDGKDPTAGVHMTGSSLVNPSQKPIHLQFLIAGKGTNTLEGHDELKDGLLAPTAYYVAYAPEAEIHITRGQVYGAVVADRVVLDGDANSLVERDIAPAVIHFDTALLEDTGNPPILKVLSVRHY